MSMTGLFKGNLFWVGQYDPNFSREREKVSREREKACKER